MTAQVLSTTTTSNSSNVGRNSSLRLKLTPYRDNAADVLPLRVNVTDANYKDQIIQVVQELCPFLKKYNNLAVNRLGGGLSNELFIVQSEDGQKSVLVRIHPTNTSNLPSIVDRDVENAISAWLSSQSVGPTYFGRFQNGRVEEFYPNHAPLSWRDLNRVGPTHVAPIMAQFHSLRVPSTVLEKTTTTGDLFQRVNEWMELADQLCQENSEKEKASQLLALLKQDWRWVEETLLETPRDNLTPAQQTAADFLGEIVFTHMDMQSLNLLRDTTVTDRDVIKVIDFEYSGFNPRAVDMANTFCEHCDMNNIRAVYAEEYPKEHVQNEFVKSYIRNLSPAPTGVMEYLEDPQFLEAARTEIGRYTLVSHMSWAIWSMVQTHVSDINFDYVLYASHRRDGFEFMKNKFF